MLHFFCVCTAYALWVTAITIINEPYMIYIIIHVCINIVIVTKPQYSYPGTQLIQNRVTNIDQFATPVINSSISGYQLCL